jgi:two-component system response regulator HydG
MDTRHRIALIDDNRAWLDTLAEYLGERGYHVHTADRSRTGLDLIDRHEVVAVVVDFRMPEMDGLQLLHRLRHLGRRVEVLMLSGEEDKRLESRALAEGAAAFLSKATAPAQLLRTLLHALAHAVQRGGRVPALRRPGFWLPVPVSHT